MRAARGALDAREKQERKDYATVHARSGNRCEVALKGQRCTWTRMPGCHHVTKRSQGGKFKGPDYLIDVCWPHHDLTDNASASQRTTLRDGTMFYGRLRIVALGGGKFRCWMDTAGKASARLSALAQAAAEALETDVRGTGGATFHKALRTELKRATTTGGAAESVSL